MSSESKRTSIVFDAITNQVAVDKITRANALLEQAKNLELAAQALKADAAILAGDAITLTGVQTIEIPGKGAWAKYQHVSTSFKSKEYDKFLVKRGVSATLLEEGRAACTTRTSKEITAFQPEKKPREAGSSIEGEF